MSSAAAQEPPSNINPNKWYWEDDDQFKEFDPVKQLEIETAYNQYLNDKTKGLIKIKGITRSVDQIAASYYIDFDQFIQVNAKTRYVRRIRASNANKQPLDWDRSYEWRYYDQNWISYPDEIQPIIENRYQSYISNQGSTSKFVLVANRDQFYEIKLSNLKQINLKTKFVRSISRV